MFVASLESKGGAQIKRFAQEIYKYARERYLQEASSSITRNLIVCSLFIFLYIEMKILPRNGLHSAVLLGMLEFANLYQIFLKRILSILLI